MEIHLDYEIALRLFISFCIGAAIGLEREYHSKAAGLRTMIMTCLGSTIFTGISISVGGASNPDRIAASIVTGVGFLGAGVIFKEGLSVTGITTATTIWICAALGTAVGAGEYLIAIYGSIIVLFVLVFLGKAQMLVEKLHQTRTYKIRLEQSPILIPVLEDHFDKFSITYFKLKDYKEENSYILVYELSGPLTGFDKLNNILRSRADILSFIY